MLKPSKNTFTALGDILNISLKLWLLFKTYFPRKLWLLYVTFYKCLTTFQLVSVKCSKFFFQNLGFSLNLLNDLWIVELNQRNSNNFSTVLLLHINRPPQYYWELSNCLHQFYMGESQVVQLLKSNN